MKKMKIILLLLFFASCTKENIEPDATCGFVFEKYYQWYPATPTDTMWMFRMAKDTLVYPMGSPPNHYWIKQVDKPTWNITATITRYCY